VLVGVPHPGSQVDLQFSAGIRFLQKRSISDAFWVGENLGEGPRLLGQPQAVKVFAARGSIQRQLGTCFKPCSGRAASKLSKVTQRVARTRVLHHKGIWQAHIFDSVFTADRVMLVPMGEALSGPWGYHGRSRAQRSALSPHWRLFSH
jgi:hypothetical protein